MAILSAGIGLDDVYRRLSEAPGALHESVFVTIGDQISVDKEAGFLRGHGTVLTSDGDLMAGVCGVVERVNKLVSVRPLRGRYVAETGDVVVGRVTEVANKRWKVDINSQQDAQLMLSAVNLPGGVQRRRTAVDELNMRTLFCEGDLISAEVQSSHKDGSVTIHTRSLKYGKLEGGQLVKGSPYLIKRLKQHFHLLPNGVHAILGCNGYVWVGGQPAAQDSAAPGSSAARDEAGEQPDLVLAASPGQDSMDVEEPPGMAATPTKTGGARGQDEDGVNGAATSVAVPLDMREKLCRIAMSIKALNSLGFPIFPGSIMETYKFSTDVNVDIKDMLTQGFLFRLGEREARKREENGTSALMET